MDYDPFLGAGSAECGVGPASIGEEKKKDMAATVVSGGDATGGSGTVTTPPIGAFGDPGDTRGNPISQDSNVRNIQQDGPEGPIPGTTLTLEPAVILDRPLILAAVVVGAAGTEQEAVGARPRITSIQTYNRSA